MLEIYRPIVEETAISFELVVPTVEDFAARIEEVVGTHDWLVADADGAIAGYAYAYSHRAREAYQRSAEVSVYLHPDYQGQGLAKELHETHRCQSLA